MRPVYWWVVLCIFLATVALWWPNRAPKLVVRDGELTSPLQDPVGRDAVTQILARTNFPRWGMTVEEWTPADPACTSRTYLVTQPRLGDAFLVVWDRTNGRELVYEADSFEQYLRYHVSYNGSLSGKPVLVRGDHLYLALGFVPGSPGTKILAGLNTRRCGYLLIEAIRYEDSRGGNWSIPVYIPLDHRDKPKEGRGA